MGFIKSSLFISLDGVFEAPDTWHFPYFNDEMGAAVGQLMSETDATLIGRNTYDEFASYWPNADPSDPITEVMNSAPKYVVSDSLDEATWQNTTAISGDRAGFELARLKLDTRLARQAAGPWSAGCCEKGSSTSCTCSSTRSSSATARRSSPRGPRPRSDSWRQPRSAAECSTLCTRPARRHPQLRSSRRAMRRRRA